MPSVRVERLPISALGLGILGFDHLQIVFQSGPAHAGSQDGWFVMEGIRAKDGASVRLAVEGWHGGTTLSEANGGLSGEDLVKRIGTAEARGGREIAAGSEAIRLWATLVSLATEFEAQHFPYVAYALPSSVLPTLNSSSLIASLLHHAGLDVASALPENLRLSPGTSTLLGTSRGDVLAVGKDFTTLVAGDGADDLTGSNDARVDKLYGGRGDDVLHWSHGLNIIHGGQPDLAPGEDGRDTVDYSGAGTVLIEALASRGGPGHPEFVVTFPGGRDHLISIEEIRWDDRSDHVVIGDGVGLADVPQKIKIGPEDGNGGVADPSQSGTGFDLSLDRGGLLETRACDTHAARLSAGGADWAISGRPDPSEVPAVPDVHSGLAPADFPIDFHDPLSAGLDGLETGGLEFVTFDPLRDH